jgi:hypothetical protein
VNRWFELNVKKLFEMLEFFSHPGFLQSQKTIVSGPAGYHELKRHNAQTIEQSA